MSDDASLDRFDSTDTGSDETESVAPDDAESPAESAATVADADPAVSTYEWSPAGGECADCGASVERRWRADGERDGGLVCADCKEW
ncbi:DUF7573 domain-containing protein [Halorussus aquaticus]|uniref:DUF7573 domain-containing protein n=1 Tax=Halorussus aquaticus TaxID=2953748 RepID=A0ABD5Q1S8_9EURY|nr:hypothetical protein [Halorussus aquaticus]